MAGINTGPGRYHFRRAKNNHVTVIFNPIVISDLELGKDEGNKLLGYFTCYHHNILESEYIY